jgi:hypothetical protein
MKVRRPSTMSSYKQSYVTTNMKYSFSVMVWGCFSGKKGRVSLFFLPTPRTTMNSQIHGCVERELFPWMELHGVTRFLQDGVLSLIYICMRNLVDSHNTIMIMIMSIFIAQYSSV